MRSLASLLVTGHLLTSPLHPADFQLTPSQLAPSSGIMSPIANAAKPLEPGLEPRYSIAQGFGNGVPLSFAAKQIVPSAFQVTYRRGVNQNQLVSWFGGRPWNEVLWLALRQQGLHMAVLGRTVTIWS